MKNKIKVWFITAASLVLIGSVIFIGAMAMLKWDFKNLSTVKYETNNYVIDENYKDISIITDTADIVFLPSESSETEVVCYEHKNGKHSVAVTDETLEIKIDDTRKWYEYIGITLGTPKITVYLPKTEYGTLFIKGSTGDIDIPKTFGFDDINIAVSTGDVKSFASTSGNIKIKASTGDIKLGNITAKAIELSVSTGDITASDVICENEIKLTVSTGETNLTNIKCNNITSNGDTGYIKLSDVLASGKLFIERDTGDVKFEKCDAGEIFIKTSTGDIKGSLLTEKIFFAESNTGSVSVPKTLKGGKCEIKTDTGDIKVNIYLILEETL